MMSTTIIYLLFVRLSSLFSQLISRALHIFVLLLLIYLYYNVYRPSAAEVVRMERSVTVTTSMSDCDECLRCRPGMNLDSSRWAAAHTYTAGL